MSSTASSTKKTSVKKTFDDFNSLDVKASSTRSTNIKPSKSIEDDAWNLLNN